MNAPSDGQRERIRNLFDDAINVSGPAPTFTGAEPLPPGHLLGKCRIEKELGKGGMGAVYLARHTTLDVPVAVKVLPPQVAQQSPEFAERFLREARLAAQLRHPNVVPVMDADRDEATGLHYIVQEYVDGGSIRDKMRKGPIDEKNALRVVTAVAKALDAAAQHGIVHRDIKPDNILLSREGTVKLADLGLAKRVGEESSGLTLTTSPMGTPFYMSPEQIQDVKRVDIRSDLYSLGATLFHMMTGVPPFQGDNVYSIIHKVMNDPVPDPREKKPEISDFAARICMRMMSKEPGTRPQTPKALLEDLRSSTVPPTARREVAPRPKTARRRAVPARRSAAPVLVIVLVVLFGCVGLGGLFGVMGYFWTVQLPEEEPSVVAPPSMPGMMKPVDLEPTRRPLASVVEALARGCILALSFDGAITDLSARAHPVRAVGTTRIGEGRVGAALRFNGEDAYVDLPPLLERTVAMWVRPEKAAQMGWYDGGTSDAPHEAFQIGMFRPGGVNPGDSPYPRNFGVFMGFWTIDAVAPCNEITADWHHVVVRWDGDRDVRIAVDGVFRSGSVVHHATNYAAGNGEFDLIDRPAPPADAPTRLGMIRAPFWNEGGTHFNGVLDEVAVWDRALTEQEILMLYDFSGRGESYCEAIGRINR